MPTKKPKQPRQERFKISKVHEKTAEIVALVSARFNRRGRRFSLFLYCSAFAIAWAAGVTSLTPSTGLGNIVGQWCRQLGQERTRRILATQEKLIKDFRLTHNEPPASLNELRLYAIIAEDGKPFSAYDGFANRLEFLRLSKDYYVLRSFGRDGAQNRLAGENRDPGIFYIGDIPAAGLTYNFTRVIGTEPYPAALLQGLDSADHSAHARLYPDALSGTRRLAVRRRERSAQYEAVMFAPHDMVEEFFWLPDNRRIVYTATGSSRYMDGIYIWDTNDDSTISLLDELSRFPTGKGMQATGSSAASPSLYLSLSCIVQGRVPSVLFFAADRPPNAGDPVPLEPSEFFTAKNLFVVEVGDESRSIRRKFVSDDELASLIMPLAKPLASARQTNSLAIGFPAQAAYINLPVSGPTEKVLTAWQDYASDHADSAVFPYSLWYLAALYASAWSNPTGPREQKDSLRAFSGELSAALMTSHIAPQYLRAFGRSLFDHVNAGSTVNFKFAKLE